MFRLFECCALSFFERFVLSFSLKIERFVSDSAEIWICGLYMNKILVTLLALIGGSCISFAQMETGRVSDTAEDTLRIENEIVAVDTGFYQSVVRYDTVRYNLKMQSVYKKAFQLKNDVFVEKMKEPWLDDILRNILFK